MLPGRDRRRVAPRRRAIGTALLALAVAITGLAVASPPAGAAVGPLSLTPGWLPDVQAMVGTSEDREVVATNGGDVAVEVTGVRIEPHRQMERPTRFSVTEDGCSGVVLAPGASCSVTLTFSPLVDGIDAGDLVFEGETETRMSVTGTVIPPGWLRTDPHALDGGAVMVGSVGEPASVTVFNTGGVDVRVDGLRLGGVHPDGFRIVDDGCTGAVLAPMEGCVASVVFAPTVVGPATATLEVPNDGADRPVVALSGEGLPPRCETHAVAGHGAVVRLVYLELLGRCPDDAGFAYWVDRLDRGTAPDVFTRTISATSEAVGRVVDDAYLTMLGRRSEPAGRAYWVARLQADGRYDRLLADLGASEEYRARSGDRPAGFVTRAYERLLGRAPDEAGLRYWVDRLASGDGGRELVLALANEDEPLGWLVTLSYREILDRDPTATERTAGVAHLRSTGDRSALYARMIGRSEFRLRAQSLPNPD